MSKTHKLSSNNIISIKKKLITTIMDMLERDHNVYSYRQDTLIPVLSPDKNTPTIEEELLSKTNYKSSISQYPHYAKFHHKSGYNANSLYLYYEFLDKCILMLQLISNNKGLSNHFKSNSSRSFMNNNIEEKVKFMCEAFIVDNFIKVEVHDARVNEYNKINSIIKDIITIYNNYYEKDVKDSIKGIIKDIDSINLYKLIINKNHYDKEEYTTLHQPYFCVEFKINLSSSIYILPRIIIFPLMNVMAMMFIDTRISIMNVILKCYHFDKKLNEFNITEMILSNIYNYIQNNILIDNGDDIINNKSHLRMIFDMAYFNKNKKSFKNINFNNSTAAIDLTAIYTGNTINDTFIECVLKDNMRALYYVHILNNNVKSIEHISDINTIKHHYILHNEELMNQSLQIGNQYIELFQLKEELLQGICNIGISLAIKDTLVNHFSRKFNDFVVINNYQEHSLFTEELNSNMIGIDINYKRNSIDFIVKYIIDEEYMEINLISVVLFNDNNNDKFYNIANIYNNSDNYDNLHDIITEINTHHSSSEGINEEIFEIIKNLSQFMLKIDNEDTKLFKSLITKYLNNINSNSHIIELDEKILALNKELQKFKNGCYYNDIINNTCNNIKYSDIQNIQDLILESNYYLGYNNMYSIYKIC